MSLYLTIPGLFMTPAHRTTSPEAELRAVRLHAALLRTLLAELDELTEPCSPRLAQLLAGQSVEELTHLAHRMLEAAAAIAPHTVGSLLPPMPGSATIDEADPSDSC